MGRHKIVRDFPLKPATVKWEDGAEKDEIADIIEGLSEHVPAACRGKLNKSILWAVRLLHECYAVVPSDAMRLAERMAAMEYEDRPTNDGDESSVTEGDALFDMVLSEDIPRDRRPIIRRVEPGSRSDG